MRYEISDEDFLAFNEILPSFMKLGYEDEGRFFVDHSALLPETLEYWDPACHAVKGMDLQEFLEKKNASCECAEEIRREVLLRTDFTLLPDSPFPEGDRQVIVKFRQDLRDLNEDPSWPRIVWPVSGVSKIDEILDEELKKRGQSR